MRARPVEVPFEQAVYGSFPFWDRGYAVLSRSPGCRPEWISELRGACQRFGERPGGVAEAEVRGLFAIRLASKGRPWMIVGVGSPGSDDRGRPGALAFHALFLRPRDYRRAGCDPFALAGALRHDWTADNATRPLPSGTWTIPTPGPAADPSTIDPHAARIASALSRGRRVAIEASAPIDALARQVWRASPDRVRRRATLATWAFGTGNRFDLVALPRRAAAGVVLDASYIQLDAAASDDLDAERPAAPTHTTRRGPGHALPIVGVAALLAGALFGLCWQRGHSVGDGDGPTRDRPDPPARVAPDRASTPPPPARADFNGDPAEPDDDERRRVAEALVALAERFGMAEAVAAMGTDDPTALMVLVSDRLRYRGPWLDAADLARLSAAPGRDPALAMRWHAQVRHFADDRPLPDDFAHGPLRWQLDTLAWSFHLDPDPGSVLGRRTAAEVPHALAAALANDAPLPPTPLSSRYPALAAYRAFLGRLPRR